jgi:hypothetical protein
MKKRQHHSRQPTPKRLGATEPILVAKRRVFPVLTLNSFDDRPGPISDTRRPADMNQIDTVLAG